MAKYLDRTCPRCKGYLGVVIPIPTQKTTEFPVNGFCAVCRYKLTWKVIQGKRLRLPPRGRKLKSFCLAVLFGLVLTFGGYGEAAAQAKPCAPDLASCPAHGCAKPGTPEALVNELKGTKPTSTTLVFLTLDD